MSHKTLLFALTFFCGSAGHSALAQDPSAPASSNWCEKTIRPELRQLPEIKTGRSWFKVYQTGDGVYAICEPYNYQEVVSYLILGKEKALLFDTGMGLDSISSLVKELTPLPVIVLNSHTHYDHIGGNYMFNHILAMDMDYTRKHAAIGYPHALVRQEVAPDALCLQRLPGTDTAAYSIRPFTIARFISDGYILHLGGREITVIATPGHAPDALALLDKASGYLWPGDSFYEGPIFLFGEETDLEAYGRSMGKLALLAPGLKRVFPSHNIPFADPGLLVEAHKAFMEVENGAKRGVADGKSTLLFKFDKFSFLIGKDLLPAQPGRE